MALFMAFHLWIGPGYNLTLAVNFSTAILLLTTLGLDPFSDTYLNKLLLCPVIENNSV
jgi:hypothetical protein